MSTNISKEKREKLVEKIKAIKTYIATAPHNENTAQLLTYIAEIEKDIKGKKYGLVFEEHREAIDELLETHTPVLTEDKSLFVDNGGQMNFLIEGDNLASLQLLEKTHKGKIDLIYIDPPYNTGNKDFIYDDNFIDAHDAFRHSKWLSFMEKRLKIARKLLSQSGVIFISIDDNEQAQLKLLCDSIFNEKNFAGILIQEKGNAQNDAHNLQKNHEYIFVYFNQLERNPFLLNYKEYELVNVYQDEGGFFYKGAGIVTGGEGGTLNRRPNLGHTIYFNKETLDIIAVEDYNKDKALVSNNIDEIYVTNQELIAAGYIAIRPPNKGDKLGVWTWSLEKINKEKKNLLITENGRGFSVVKKVYIPKNEIVRTKHGLYYKKLKVLPTKSVIRFPTAKGSAVLNELLGMKKFDNPKNLDMIAYLVSLYDKSDSIILDFFAGSGTTGHAVMKLNAEDGGRRKFILCTNNENNICREVTYERIKRVIDKEKYSASLKYFKVDYLPISDKLYYEYADELLKHIKELVELENGINFDGNAEIAIILTEDELDAFTASLTSGTVCKAIYLGHDVLTSEAQEKLFKKYNIAINVIPDYYYKDLED